MATDRRHVVWRDVQGRRVRCRIVEPAKPGTEHTSLSDPLLLLHGLAGSSDAWGPLLRSLVREGLNRAVLAPDLPGYGRSPGPPGAFGIDALTDWVVGLLDVMELGRVHVVAHSMGCQVALALARRHPERVGGLVLAGPTTGRRLMPGWRYGLGLVNSLRESLLYNITAFRMYLQMGPVHYLSTVRQMLAADPLDGISSVRAPCLVLRGEHDPIIPEAIARRLALLLPRGAFLPVPGAAHVVQFSQTAAFRRLALAFLAGAGPFV